jgi:hypothetical protein
MILSSWFDGLQNATYAVSEGPDTGLGCNTCHIWHPSLRISSARPRDFSVSSVRDWSPSACPDFSAVGLESIHRSDSSPNPYRAKRRSSISPAGPAPTMMTSYFSDVLSDGGCGARRGSGGANEGRTRSSRDAAAYSVKTGMFVIQHNSWGFGLHFEY